MPSKLMVKHVGVNTEWNASMQVMFQFMANISILCLSISFSCLIRRTIRNISHELAVMSTDQQNSASELYEVR